MKETSETRVRTLVHTVYIYYLNFIHLLNHFFIYSLRTEQRRGGPPSPSTPLPYRHGGDGKWTLAYPLHYFMVYQSPQTHHPKTKRSCCRAPVVTSARSGRRRATHSRQARYKHAKSRRLHPHERGVGDSYCLASRGALEERLQSKFTNERIVHTHTYIRMIRCTSYLFFRV